MPLDCKWAQNSSSGLTSGLSPSAGQGRTPSSEAYHNWHALLAVVHRIGGHSRRGHVVGVECGGGSAIQHAAALAVVAVLHSTRIRPFGQAAGARVACSIDSCHAAHS